MSASTSIKEGGQARPFGPVEVLMVEGDDGKYYPWYPEADRALGTLSVEKNGFYMASDRGVYGWSRIAVNVQTDSVTGRDPETGEEKTVTVDPQTGELVETSAPVEIRVIMPPTKTIYADGEIIDYSGIVVHAYGSAGQDLGAVPFSELVFPVTTAVPGDAIEVDDDELVQPVYLLPVSVGNTIQEYEWNGIWFGYYYSGVTGGPVYLVCVGNQAYGESVFVSKDWFTVTWQRTCPSGWSPQITSMAGIVQTYEDYEAYVSQEYGGHNLFVNGGYSPISADQPIGLTNAAILAMNKVAAGEGVSVSFAPVQWSRPGDGAILETTLTITVTGGD